MILEDRKKEIYSTSGNISMCQNGCQFESYDKNTKKAKCNCDIQINKTETDMKKINFEQESIEDSFLNTLKNSNFLVLKCYKLALEMNHFFKNKGRIIMSVILLSFIILLFIYYIRDRKKIISYIRSILNDKFKSSNNNNQLKENDEIKNKKKGKKKRKKKKKKKGKKLINKDINLNNNNCEPPRKIKINKMPSMIFEENKRQNSHNNFSIIFKK